VAFRDGSPPKGDILVGAAAFAQRASARLLTWRRSMRAIRHWRGLVNEDAFPPALHASWSAIGLPAGQREMLGYPVAGRTRSRRDIAATISSGPAATRRTRAPRLRTEAQRAPRPRSDPAADDRALTVVAEMRRASAEVPAPQSARWSRSARSRYGSRYD